MLTNFRRMQWNTFLEERCRHFFPIHLISLLVLWTGSIRFSNFSDIFIRRRYLWPRWSAIIAKKLWIIVPRDFRDALSRLVAEIARMHPVIHGLFGPDAISKSKRARIFGRHHRHRVNSGILSSPWRTIRSSSQKWRHTWPNDFAPDPRLYLWPRFGNAPVRARY